MRVEEIIKAVSPREIVGSTEKEISGICTDSRELAHNQLFIALKGENHDGHRFVPQALGKGAAAVIVEKISTDWPIASGQVVLRVDDTLGALRQIAAWWLKKSDIKVVAVTGSNGKTTTKDLVAAALGRHFQVLKTEGNFNNEIGLPLTVLRLRDAHQVAVLEMGMRGPGQIARLCKIAPPHIGIITGISGTHFELLGSMENIALAKAELIEALPDEGHALLNGDNEWCRRIAGRTKAFVSYFGLNGAADFRATSISFSARRGTHFTVKLNKERWKFTIPLLGEHNVRNALAAIGTAVKMGVAAEKIIEGLQDVSLSGRRQERIVGGNEVLILDDTYNANADSMIAALSVLKKLPGRRHIAVLGDMLELGEISLEKHRLVGSAAALQKIDLLVAIGDLAADIRRGAIANGISEKNAVHFDNIEEAIDFLDEFIKPQDTVLVKASRGMHLERIVEHLR